MTGTMTPPVPARAQVPADTMQAVAVIPGRSGSAHLTTLPRPRVTDIPGGRGVLVRVLRVGVDGTD